MRQFTQAAPWRARVVTGVGAALLGLVVAQSAGAAPTADQIAKATAAVDTQAVIANAATTQNWLAYGLDYASTRFSRLKQIDAANVSRLGLVWSFDLGSTHHGVEATPIVVQGVMYVTAPWNIVYALDAQTGEKIWSYDPKVPRTIGYKGCCDVVNRGVVVYKGKVYEATYDGRLIALDAATGKPVWSTRTVPADGNYTITGAPLVAHGKVVIGNGGAEYFGVRGSVSAYDAETGKLDWRWYTVPGDPAHKPENAAMAQALKTWDPKTKYWLKGGGGTVWNTFSYDPKLGLLYFGTGNANPWNRADRGGAAWHNLYTASVVALDLKTGKYAWSYQTTIADPSDYDADQDWLLADLKIGGKEVPVVMNANKNGYFFVLDRRTGKFISAQNFVPVNWAKGYTREGKPIETDLFASGKPFDSVPGPGGGHNWQSMSYSPQTGLVYIPAQHIPFTLAPLPEKPTDTLRAGGTMSGTGWNLGMALNTVPAKSVPFGRLVAWNPLTQSEAWSHEYPAPWNGGTLATAGDLVFQGTATGQFMAFDAGNGKKLWESKVGQGVIAAPMTYSVDGRQYVTLAVGWGGVMGQSFRATDHEDPGTVFTYALDGKAVPPDFSKYPMGPLLTGVKYAAKDVPAGARLYANNCALCHGVPGANGGGSIPNLGHVGVGVIENLERFVFNGPFVSNGMPDFTGKLTPADVVKIKAYIQSSAEDAAKKLAAAKQ